MTKTKKQKNKTEERRGRRGEEEEGEREREVTKVEERRGGRKETETGHRHGRTKTALVLELPKSKTPASVEPLPSLSRCLQHRWRVHRYRTGCRGSRAWAVPPRHRLAGCALQPLQSGHMGEVAGLNAPSSPVSGETVGGCRASGDGKPHHLGLV